MKHRGADFFRILAAVGVLCVLPHPQQALAYDGDDHQRLTFLAAKQFNRCIADTGVLPLTALQVRYMARSNVGLAEGNPFSRMFRWRYYNRDQEAEKSFFGVVDTRFHEQFNELVRRVDGPMDEVETYQALGRIVSYLQMVTSPPRVVPVYTARFWRLSFSDRYDSYPLDEAALEAALGDDCGFLQTPAGGYEEILSATAQNTLQAVMAPIPGMPVSWQAFWKLGDNAHNFGEYGPAGNNFGRRTQFRCGSDHRCMLLNDDPLYAEFALERHLQAVRSTVAAMYLIQRSRSRGEVVGAGQ